MKFLPLVLATAGLLSAQSNPSWWKYVPPESKSIVGIQWKELRQSLFGPAIAAELAPGGTFGFPDLELLRNAEQILIGSPTMLAVEYGTFPIAKLRTQAAEKGLKRATFKRAELWISSDPNVMSVAYIQEKLLLIGNRANIEDAVDRVSDPKNQAYSPLLARAARYSKEDLWVVASRLPDPLASKFVPLEVEANAFEGAFSVWDGLHLVAAIERPTPLRALDFADSLAENLASRPALSEATEISTRDRSVLIRMDLDPVELASTLRMPVEGETSAAESHELLTAAPVKPQPRSFVPPDKSNSAPVTAEISSAAPESPAVEPSSQPPPQAALPPPPRVIRILGLESGPREIPLGQ